MSMSLPPVSQNYSNPPMDPSGAEQSAPVDPNGENGKAQKTSKEKEGASPHHHRHHHGHQHHHHPHKHHHGRSHPSGGRSESGTIPPPSSGMAE